MGGKEPPIIIGKAASPRCFKMPHLTSPIPRPGGMSRLMTNLNRRLVKERRNILLLLGNVSSHSPDLKDKFSNMKLTLAHMRSGGLQ